MKQVNLRIVFAGNDIFALPILMWLVDAKGIEVSHVVTSESRPAGRGMRLTPTPIAETADLLGIKYTATNDSNVLAQVTQDAKVDFLIVCAYGCKLNEAAISAAKKACINLHASLLPRWRGAAPVERAIMAGDKKTGVTSMLIGNKIDAGAMLLQSEYPLNDKSTGGAVREALSQLGAQLILKTLEDFEKITPVIQDETLACRAPKLSKQEALLNLQLPAVELERMIRAFDPIPGAFLYINGKRIKVFSAEVVEVNGIAGTVMSADKDIGLIVSCEQHALKLLEIQPEGGIIMNAAEYLRGRGSWLREGMQIGKNL